MRKILSLVLAAILLFSLAACDSGWTESGSSDVFEEYSNIGESDTADRSTTRRKKTTTRRKKTTTRRKKTTTAKGDKVTTTAKPNTGNSVVTTGKTDSPVKPTSTTKPATPSATKKPATTTTTKNPATTTTTKKPLSNVVSWEKPSTSYKSNNYSYCIKYRTPLTNTYNKLTKDKKLNVVYFGGSLTNGYGCDNIETDSWRAKSGAWLKTNFPNATINLVDTAIGESGTHLGVYRVQRDVIGSKPDLLFIEYAINDLYDGASQALAALRFETIVREVRRALPTCDIVTVLTTDQNRASTTMAGNLFATAQGHANIAQAYGLNVLNIGYGMVKNIAKIEGNNTWWNNSTLWNKYFKRKADGKADGVHPNSAGHNQYYLVVKEFLENSLKNTNYSGYSTTERNSPVVQSSYLFDGNRTSIAGADLQKYFVASKSSKTTYSNLSFYSGTSKTPHKGYFQVNTGGYATFNFTGTEISIWTNLYSPSKLTYSIDGGAEKTITFDGHAPTIVVTGLKSGSHTIRLKANATMKLGYIFTRDASKQTVKGTRT